MDKDIVEYNENSQGLLPFIEHNIDAVVINQRAYDGYINATTLCMASGKSFADYNRLENTKAFLSELSSDMRIPISDLVQIIKGGNPKLQGTWIHQWIAGGVPLLQSIKDPNPDLELRNIS